MAHSPTAAEADVSSSRGSEKDQGRAERLARYGFSPSTTIREFLFNLRPKVLPLAHTAAPNIASSSPTNSVMIHAALDSPPGNPEFVPPQRVVVTDLLPSLKRAALKILASCIDHSVLDSTVATRAREHSKTFGYRLDCLLYELDKFVPESSNTSTERDVDMFINEFVGISTYGLSNLVDSLSNTRRTPRLELDDWGTSRIKPDWSVKGVKGELVVLGQNKNAQASAPPNGLLLQLDEFKLRTAGLHWSEVPATVSAQGSKVSGLRKLVTKTLFHTINRTPSALWHVYCTTKDIAIASLLTLSPHESGSPPTPLGLPYLYAISTLIPLDTPGLLLILLLQAHGVQPELAAAAPAHPRPTATASEDDSNSPDASPFAQRAVDFKDYDDAAGDIGEDYDNSSIGSDNNGRKRRRRKGGPAGAAPQSAKRPREHDEGPDDKRLPGLMSSSAAPGYYAGDAGSSSRDDAEDETGAGSGGRAGGSAVQFTGAAQLSVRWMYGARHLLAPTRFRKILPPALSMVPQVAKRSPSRVQTDAYPSPQHPLPKVIPLRLASKLLLSVRLPPTAITSAATTAYIVYGSTRLLIKTTIIDCPALKLEAALYERASAAGIAPPFCGLFEEEVKEGETKQPRNALLMGDGGERLRVPMEDLPKPERVRLYNLVVDLHTLTGMMHKDIAPRNILVDGARRFRLCDFGRAKLHACPGEEHCDELVALRQEVGLDEAGSAAETGEAAA